jgi:hypothetical protein
MMVPEQVLPKIGLRDAWASEWRNRSFRVQAILTAVCLPAILRTLTVFLNGVEERHGVILPDPLLALFPAVDIDWLTFLLIYGGLVGAVILLMKHPRYLLLAVQTYVLMVIFRIAAMYLVPLDPPPGTIDLRDPVVQYLGTGRMLTRDLFFSGHTATLILIGLSMPTRKLQLLYYGCAVVVGVCVLAQHAHYTIDVFAAPFFAYGAYRVIVLMHERVFQKPRQ